MMQVTWVLAVGSFEGKALLSNQHDSLRQRAGPHQADPTP